MEIVRNQYITLSGISPEFISPFHKALEKPEMRVRAVSGEVLNVVCVKNGPNCDRHTGLYTIELECPLEYADGSKTTHLDGKALLQIYRALGGLYPLMEIVDSNVLETVVQTIKMTGISTEHFSALFSVCGVALSNYRLSLKDGHPPKEIQYIHMLGAEWSDIHKTFTVSLRIDPKQIFKGNSQVVRWYGNKAVKAYGEYEQGALCAPRSVLNMLYRSIFAYDAFREAYDDWFD